MAVTINNFPPNSTQGEMRTLMFGPTGPMRVLIDIDGDSVDDIDIDLTVSNAAEHAELKEFLTDLIELLQIVVGESDFEESLADAIEKKRASYADGEDEYLDEDDFFDEDDD